MIKELKCEIEKRAECAENLSFCMGLKLLNVKDQIAQMLSTIGTNGIFEQYTKHDISHIDQMLEILEWLIPQKTKEKMSGAEWLMLTLAVYCHDLGMVVSKNEYEKRDTILKFVEFKEDMKKTANKENAEYFNDDKNIYQEFVRKHHAERVKCWLENKTPHLYGRADDQVKILNNMFAGVSDFEMFKKGLGMVCESHHLDDLDHFEKYKIAEHYGSGKECSVNLNYICILLRIADLLHITNDRTPTISMILLGISNPTSILEWEKQKAVKSIEPQPKRNDEGKVDNSLEKDTIEITAYFSGSETANAYFGLSSYLQYVKEELRRCNKIAKAAQMQEGSEYAFPWKEIDESNIVTEGFETKKLSFSIEQNNILNLLVGHTLYNDSSVAVRELTQNAIDAVKLQRIIDQRNKKTITEGKVVVQWNDTTRVLSISDNGTGMTLEDIENYLLKVGASKYRQKAFEEEYSGFNPISRFGIGILTCFMIADDIDIETNSVDSNEVNQLHLRSVTGNYLLKKTPKAEASAYIKEHGTIIRLKIRSDTDMSELEKTLKKWVVISEIPIILEQNGDTKEISAKSAKEALTHFLNNGKFNVDGINIKVEEKTAGNVTVACALRYNQYMSYWSFLTTDEVYRRTSHGESNDIVGTCVEGIRVEFSSPGYSNYGIIALANISGSKFQTNVARTALEYDSNQDILKSIYECYCLFVQEQIESLTQNHFSNAWAVSEGVYLTSKLLSFQSKPTRDDTPRLINVDLFKNAFSTLKILFVERDENREILSINDVNKFEKFDTFEFRLLNIIENMFIEVNTNTTVSKMIETVCGNNVIHSANPVITNFYNIGFMQEELLRGRQISRIVIDADLRKIQLTFENRVNNWHLLCDGEPPIYLPANNFQIEGLKNEIGVKTRFGIYLNSGTELSDYIKKLFNQFTTKSSREKEMFSSLIHFLFNQTNMLTSKIKKEDAQNYIESIRKHRTILFDADSDFFSGIIWDILNKDEFKEIVLLKSYSLFSLDNWSRQK